MNGRQRVAQAAGAGQPRRLWELLSESGSGMRRDIYQHRDGYRVEVWFTGAGSVYLATLTAPSGRHRYVPHYRGRGKLDTVLGWLADPAAALATTLRDTAIGR